MSTLNIQTDADLRAAADSGKLTAMKRLNLHNTRVTDITPLAGLTGLTIYGP